MGNNACLQFVAASFNPNSIGGGGGRGSIGPCDEKLREKKWPGLHNNNTALIKQISLFDTALAMTNTFNSITITDTFQFNFVSIAFAIK